MKTPLKLISDVFLMIVNQIYLSNRPIGIVRGSPEECYEYLKTVKV